jgi:hypothetical protein
MSGLDADELRRQIKAGRCTLASESLPKMHIVYWAHSYRDEDAPVNKYFGVLIEKAAEMVVNFDPPSKTVNSSKLERNLLVSDGMVAVLTWRASGPSQYILYEIGLALRGRKPLVVFLDDRLPSDIVPPRVLQRRFSSRTYFHQVREHTHALRILKEYMGDPPPVRYQPSSGQRSCGLLGLDAISAVRAADVHQFVASRGYRPVDMWAVETGNPLSFAGFEYVASLDVLLACADSSTAETNFWRGTLGSASVPAITFTANAGYPFDDRFPLEFQPRPLDASSSEAVGTTLSAEFGLFEQDFLEASDEEAIERYTQTLVRAGSLDGRYESGTRGIFTEVIMGDQYTNSGQAGAFGPGAHAHDMTFQQIWGQMSDKVDLTALAGELAKLRLAMESEAKQPSEKFAVGAIAAAEESAKLKDGPKVMEYLKSAGKWAFSVAEKIGVGIAMDALKSSLGI